jgi:hypothetical protein
MTKFTHCFKRGLNRTAGELTVVCARKVSFAGIDLRILIDAVAIVKNRLKPDLRRNRVKHNGTL